METRTPKNRYNGGYNTETPKATTPPKPKKHAGVKVECQSVEMLEAMEQQMHKNAEQIAHTVSDMFQLVCLMASMLPNMELDTGIMHLKTDDDGVFIEINSSACREYADIDCFGNCVCNDCCGLFGCDDEDDEEGLLYDGD